MATIVPVKVEASQEKNKSFSNSISNSFSNSISNSFSNSISNSFSGSSPSRFGGWLNPFPAAFFTSNRSNPAGFSSQVRPVRRTPNYLLLKAASIVFLTMMWLPFYALIVLLLMSRDADVFTDEGKPCRGSTDRQGVFGGIQCKS